MYMCVYDWVFYLLILLHLNGFLRLFDRPPKSDPNTTRPRARPVARFHDKLNAN